MYNKSIIKFLFLLLVPDTENELIFEKKTNQQKKNNNKNTRTYMYCDIRFET